MAHHPRNLPTSQNLKKFLWASAATVLLVAATVFIFNRSDQPRSPEEIAARWVDANVDALGEQVAGFLTGQAPALREVGGEILEDRIHDVVKWEYSQPREIPPDGRGIYAITATASVVFDVDLPLGSGHIDAGVPFELRVDQSREDVIDSKLSPLGARVNLDLPGVPPLPNAIGGGMGRGVTDLAKKAMEPGAGEQFTAKIQELIPAVATPALKPKPASADVISLTAPVDEATGPSRSDTDHVDCIAAAREEEGGNIDSIRLETIEKTDPETLIDTQRKDWLEFFDRKAPRLKTACITLWSEPITTENSDRRNQAFRGSDDKDGCVYNVEENVRRDDVHDRAMWKDTLELLQRPYLTLTIAERMVLREQLDSVSYCEEFYPQLFTGRWVPESR